MTDKTDKTDADGTVGPEQVEAFDPLPGDLLREARNRRGWTVSRVAEDMNLEVRFIEAMEENRFEDLGAPVFARGHLRKYARLLEVDSDRLMQAYAVIEKERIPPPVASAEGLRMTGDETSGGSGWRTIAIILVLLALGVLGWRLLMTRGDVAAPAVGVTAPQPSPEGRAGDEDAIDAPVAVPLPAIVTATEPPSEADDALESTPPETGDDETASPTAAATAESGQPVGAGEGAVQAPVEEAPVPAGEARLVLRFTADSWVEVRDASGNRLVYQLGRAGRQRTVTGRPPFDIFLGFADGVSLELNGETVVVPASARLGRTASFRVPADTAAAIRP
jgi:cytoskeleton protein RodZ